MELKLPDRFKVLTLTVVGEQIRAPVVTDLTIDEIGKDLDVVAAQMGYWAVVLADAEEELAAAEASYRSWNANIILKIQEDQPKLAEWKVKNLAVASPQFLEHKAKIARCQRNVSVLDRLFQAFAKKANVLQSRGANQREVHQRTGVYVPANPDAEDNPTKREERDKKIKDIFGSKKKTKKKSSKKKDK